MKCLCWTSRKKLENDTQSEKGNLKDRSDLSQGIRMHILSTPRGHKSSHELTLDMLKNESVPFSLRMSVKPIQVFRTLITNTDLNLEEDLLNIFIDWSIRYPNKKLQLLLTVEVVYMKENLNSIKTFELVELNEFVNIVSLECLKTQKTSYFKVAVYFFKQMISLGNFTWSLNLLKALCVCVLHVNVLEVVHFLLLSKTGWFYLMEFVKLISFPQTSVGAIEIVREELWGENPVNFAGDFAGIVLIKLEEVSLNPEVSYAIFEYLQKMRRKSKISSTQMKSVEVIVKNIKSLSNKKQELFIELSQT